MIDRRFVSYLFAFSLAALPLYPQMSHPASWFFYGSLIPLLFLLICISPGISWRRLSGLALFYPLCAVLVTALIYVFHSIYPYQSQEKFVRLLLGAMVYILTAAQAGDERCRRVLIIGVITGGVLLSMEAVSHQSAGYADLLESLRNELSYDPVMQRDLIQTLEAGRALGRFGNPNHLAGYLILALWAAVLLWPDCRERWQRIALGGAMVIQALCIYRTYSRSGLLVLLISVAILLVWRLGGRLQAWRRRLLWIGGAAFVVGIPALALWGGTAFGGRLFVTSTILARVHFFRHALQLIADHFPDGTGLESFRFLACRYVRPGELESLYPHNLFLGAASESGFIGLLAMVWFSVTGLRWKGRGAGIRSVVGFGSFVSFLVLSSMDFHNEIAEFLFLFFVLQGLCTGQRFERIPSLRLILLVPGIVISLFLWWILIFCPYMGKSNHQRALDALTVKQPAVRYFETALRWTPQDAAICNQYGQILFGSGIPGLREKGLFLLQKAVTLNPYQAYFHGDLAEALSQTGHVEEALAEIQAAIDLFPKKVLYLRQRARYLYLIGNREEADRCLKRAEEIERIEKERRP